MILSSVTPGEDIMAKNKNTESTTNGDGRTARVMSEDTKARLVAARSKPRTPVHEFVQGWMDNATINEIASALDISAASVQSRAKGLRKIGVKLPDRPLGGRGRVGGVAGRAGYSAITIEKLNALIAGAQAGTLGVGDDGHPTINGAPVGDDGSTAPADDMDSLL